MRQFIDGGYGILGDIWNGWENQDIILYKIIKVSSFEIFSKLKKG